MKTNTIPDAIARALQDGRAERALTISREQIDEDARTVRLAFASEAPVERSWGIEVLACSTAAMRQSRLKAGANLLCDHDVRDIVGVVESVDIGTDQVGRAMVRFGKSARAEEVFRDVVDGIRRSVSVGYLIHGAKMVEERDGVDTYRITDWEPYEISLVAVPADYKVGVGRSAETAKSETKPERPKMSDIQVTEARNHAAEITKIAATLPASVRAVADEAIQRGLTTEQYQAAALEKLASQPLPTSDIGMSRAEARSYSMVRAMNALANPSDLTAQRAAAFERECSEAAAQRTGKQAQGLLVPSDIQHRNLLAGTANVGGNTVATDLMAGEFIQALRNAMVLPGLGARMLTGLQGNIAIPRQTGAGAVAWVAENAAAGASNVTFGQVLMSPRTITANTAFSRRLLLQSSLDVESFVQEQLATDLALGIQQAAINGTGAANQPAGILTQVTTTVVGGANGGLPTWLHIVQAESDVAAANADVGTMAYLTNARVRGRLKTTSMVSGQNGFIWAGNDTPLNGYRAAVTNAVPSNLTKGTAVGVCSAIIFGNFADLIIGMWGGLELIVDPYTGSTSGNVRVTALQDVDVAIRNVASFATMVDALT